MQAQCLPLSTDDADHLTCKPVTADAGHMRQACICRIFVVPALAILSLVFRLSSLSSSLLCSESADQACKMRREEEREREHSFAAAKLMRERESQGKEHARASSQAHQQESSKVGEGEQAGRQWQASSGLVRGYVPCLSLHAPSLSSPSPSSSSSFGASYASVVRLLSSSS